MAQIHNTDLIKELKDGGKLQQLRDVIPSQLADKVVPVMEVNPKMLRRTNVMKALAKATSGTSTIYTTPSDKDFFLTGAVLTLNKDAANDLATGTVNLTVVQDGETKTIIAMPVITLTAQDKTLVCPIIYPAKLDRGSVIAVSGTFGAGVLNRVGIITGFIIDNAGA
jgi:hypothetical protein